MRLGKAAFAVLSVGLLGLTFAEGAFAQISLRNDSASYAQDFNTLSAAAGQPMVSYANNSSTQGMGLPGLYARQFGGSAATGTPTVYRPDNGSATFGALFSYGTGTQTDRALGSAASATPGAFEYGFRFTNDGTTTITGFTLKYTGEQWRNSATDQQKLAFSYAKFSSGITGDIGNEANSSGSPQDGRYTGVAALDFTSPATLPTSTSPGVATNGNIDPYHTDIIAMVNGLSIAKGDELWVRWVDINDVNNDHGLAIDDLSFTASFAPAVNEPEPASLVLLGGVGLPMGALWVWSRKRK